MSCNENECQTIVEEVVEVVEVVEVKKKRQYLPKDIEYNKNIVIKT